MERMYPLVSEKLPRFFHGGDYNPEQWPPEVREEDMRLMKLAHWNLATVGVFSWVSLQPGPEEWDFGWLDAVMDKLAEGGMFACLATPTAAPPAWFSHQHPASLRTDAQGRRHRHGNRVNYCPNSPAYHSACAEVAGRLAERYKEHPALALWHVSNEYGGVCYCETCAPRLPPLARGQVRHPRRAERALVHPLLEPHLHRLVPDRDAGPARRVHARPEAGLPPLQQRFPAGLLPERVPRPARSHARRARHDQHDGRPSGHGLPHLGAARGRGRLGLLPQRPQHAAPHRLLPRPDAGPEARPARSC